MNFLQSLNRNIPEKFYVNSKVDIDSPRTNYNNLLFRNISSLAQTNISSFNLDLEKFDNDVLKTTELFGSFLKDCIRSQPIVMHLKIKELLIDFFEKRVQRYKINNPENQEIENKWKEFVENFFRARFNFLHVSVYTPDENLSSKLLSFSNFIQEESNKIKLKTPEIQIDLEKNKFDLFKYILETNDVLLDIPVALIAGICENKKTGTLKTCIPFLIDTYNYQLNIILNNLPWVLDVCKKKLEPFQNPRQDEIKNFSKKLVSEINHIKREIMPKLQHLFLDSPSSCSNDKALMLGNLRKLFRSWEPQTIIGGIPVDADINGKKRTTFKYTDIIFIPSDQLKPLRRHYNELILRKNNGEVSDLTSKENLNNIEMIFKVHDAANDCAHLISAYFRLPALELEKLHNLILEWAIKDNYENKSVDDLLNEIESGITKSKKVKSKKPLQPRSRKTVTHCPTENFSKTLESHPSSKEYKIQEKETISLDYQIIYQLAAAVESTTDPFVKNVVRQTQMYAQDLTSAYKLLQNATEDSKLFPLITLLQSGFFYLEQLLNFQALSNNADKKDMQKDHHLLALANKTGLVLDEKTEVLQDLFLGNFWVRSPYEQLQQRESWDIPPYLRAIYQIYETEKLSAHQDLINKITDIYQRTIQFSSQLPVIKSLTNNVRKLDFGTFNHQTEITLTPCEETTAACQNLFTRLKSLWHPKLRQIICHLKVLKGILQELNKKKMDSDVFSLLVRSLLFWENTILEELLQLAYSVKTGANTYSHDLGSLFQELSNKKAKKGKEEIKFLKETMENLHNFSRYPFVHQGSNLIRTIILQAELLRERPELGLKNPFKLEKNQTNLNYLEVPSDRFSPEDIVNRLNEIHTRIFQIISKNILPRVSLES